MPKGNLLHSVAAELFTERTRFLCLTNSVKALDSSYSVMHN